MFDFWRVTRGAQLRLVESPALEVGLWQAIPELEVFERSSGSKNIVIIQGFALAFFPSLFEFLSVLRKTVSSHREA